MNVAKTLTKSETNKGFALISTISIMSLLLMLAFAMLNFSSMSARGSKTFKATEVAKANARLALMMALSELQEMAGSDQRITANASILGEDVRQPHVLGVWKSIGADGNNTHDLTALAAEYKASYNDKKRNDRFLGWLVSGNKDTTSVFNYPKPSISTNSVPLIGRNTLGFPQTEALTEEQKAKMVSANLVLNVDNNNKLGAYAWAVSGENLKARVLLEDSPNNDKLAYRSTSPINAIHSIGGAVPEAQSLKEFMINDDGTFASELNKVSSWNSFVLGGNNAAAMTHEKLSYYYHDLSVSSYGLLTNTKSGGLQKDISLLSELDTLPSEMTLSSNTKAHIFRDGPYWADLVQYAKSYKPFAEGGLVEWAADKPYYSVGESWTEATRRRGWQHRMPVVSKWLWVLSYFGEADANDPKKSRMNMVVQPVIELWNPFNLPLKMPEDSAYELKFFTMPLELSVRQTGVGDVLTNRGIHFPVGENEANKNIGQQSGATVRYTVKFVDSSGNHSAMQPGEVVLFSDGSDSPRLPSSDVITLTKGLQIRGGTFSRNIGHYGKELILPNTASVEVHYKPRNEWFYSDNYFTGPNSYPSQWSYHSEIVTKNSKDSTAAIFQPSGQLFSIGSTPRESPQPSLIIGSVLRTEHSIAATGDPSELTLSEKTRFSPYLFSPITLGQSYLTNNNPFQLETNPYQFIARRVTDFDDVHVSIEDDNGHLGRSHGADGQTHVALREIPVQPLTSMAQLQHAGLGYYSIKSDFNPQTASEISDLSDTVDTNKLKPWHLRSHPHINNALGNSFATPFTKQTEVEKVGVSPLSGPHGGESGYNATLHDKSWKLNESLWDSWFMSGIGNWNNPLITNKQTKKEVIEGFFNENKKLPNQRFERYYSNSNGTANLTKTIEAENGFQQISSHIINKGAFNVNSTSVHAWKAVLGGLDLRIYPFEYMKASNSSWEKDPSKEGYPISRFTLPNGQLAESNGSGISFWQKRWLGSRKISDEELTKLASAIVDEVRLRGPFLSVGEFVNRRLSDGDLGFQGALQAAIKSSGINASFVSDSDVINDLKANYSNKKSIDKKETGRGAPGYITQADLLMPIAPSLTVRCDTFTIRAYGEALDASGNVTARAWCQAVVQRVPDYVDSTNPADTIVTDSTGGPISGALSPINRKFGRRFVMKSFQWLSKDEI